MNPAYDSSPRDPLGHFSSCSGFFRNKLGYDRCPDGTGTRSRAGVARVTMANEIKRWLDASVIKSWARSKPLCSISGAVDATHVVMQRLHQRKCEGEFIGADPE
jgi:hypothetical protein